jgi:glyoxylase I family protein
MKKKIAYVTLPVTNLKRSFYFYEGIIGFSVCKDRPSLAYPGVWYNLGSSQLRLKLVQPHKREERSVMIHVRGMHEFIKKLDYYDIPYTKDKSSLYVTDPDGHVLLFRCAEGRENT